jgi:hypothetical protein
MTSHRYSVKYNLTEVQLGRLIQRVIDRIEKKHFRNFQSGLSCASELETELEVAELTALIAIRKIYSLPSIPFASGCLAIYRLTKDTHPNKKQP